MNLSFPLNTTSKCLMSNVYVLSFHSFNSIYFVMLSLLQFHWYPFVSFSFDFCLSKDESDSPVENLGQVVFGERIRPSPYKVISEAQCDYCHVTTMGIYYYISFVCFFACRLSSLSLWPALLCALKHIARMTGMRCQNFCFWKEALAWIISITGLLVRHSLIDVPQVTSQIKFE